MKRTAIAVVGLCAWGSLHAQVDGVPRDVIEQLGQLVFDDPITGDIVPAAEYVSGNVRDKLDAARHAAGTDPRFAHNVTALTEVLPKPLGADEIEAQLGAVWIPPDDVRQFLASQLDAHRTAANASYLAAGLRSYFRYRTTCGDRVGGLIAVISNPVH